MQVILTLSLIGLITLIFLTFMCIRVCFFEEYVIFTLGKFKILKLEGRSYSYLIYLILKHTGKKQQKRKKRKKNKPLIRFRTSICIFFKKYESVPSYIIHYFIDVMNDLCPSGYELKKIKIKLKNYDEFGVGIAIRMLI